MKKYMVFRWYEYAANGGMGDLRVMTDDLQTAIDEMNKGECGQVVTIENGQIVVVESKNDSQFGVVDFDVR